MKSIKVERLTNQREVEERLLKIIQDLGITAPQNSFVTNLAFAILDTSATRMGTALTSEASPAELELLQDADDPEAIAQIRDVLQAVADRMDPPLTDTLEGAIAEIEQSLAGIAWLFDLRVYE